MNDHDQPASILSLAARRAMRKRGAPRVVVIDSADFENTSEMRAEILAQPIDGIPRLVLLERSEMPELREQLEVNPAVDFMLKPVDYDALQARIDKLLATATELRERKDQLERVQSQVDRLAYYDRLTNLPNNEFFRRHLEFQISHAQRYNRQLAVLAIDLQSFERIDGLLGQAGVQAMLAECGRRLVRETRDYDVVGQVPEVLPITDKRMATRIDGDRFLLLLPEFRAIKDITAIVERLLSVLEVPIEFAGQEIVTRPKVGISVYPADGDNEHRLISNANAAFRMGEGVERIVFFSQAVNRTVQDRSSMARRLRAALRSEAFELLYQPKIALATGRTSGFEALLRWQDAELGAIAPARLVPLAEELGLINDVSRWVLNEVCAQSRRWQNEGLAALPVAVNLSGHDLRRSDFPDFIAGLLLDHRIAPENLQLEITEAVFIDNVDTAAAMLDELRRIGVSITLDDFGTGYSSLGHLHRIPIDTLKIDRSFIRNITTDWSSAAMTSGMIQLAHTLNLNVVAEGVESDEQLDMLKDQMCNEIQGAVYSMPLVPDAAARWQRTVNAL